MLTASQFISAWRRRHHPSADVGADAAFYYGLYCRLHAVAERCAHGFSEAHLLSLLLYAENTVAVGLDGVYEYMYRSLGDVVARWCGALGMAGAAGQVGSLITETVAAAPCSSLRRWMAASTLSAGFRPLGGMLTWLARDDKALRRVFPCLRYRKAMFMRLAGDRRAALRMLWADMAFNWRDKRGLSLPQALARQLSHAAASACGGEGRPLRQAAAILSSVSSERLDTYTMVGQGSDGALTLRRADLTTASKQCLLPADTCSASDIAEGALGLLSSMHSFPAPLRALSVAATRLSESSVRQMSLFDDGVSREEVLEKCVDEIRGKYGFNALRRGVLIGDKLTEGLHGDDGFLPFKR